MHAVVTEQQIIIAAETSPIHSTTSAASKLAKHGETLRNAVHTITPPIPRDAGKEYPHRTV